MHERTVDENKIFAPWNFVQNYKKTIRNLAPQHLIDAPTRQKIYNSVFYQQYCFGVNLVTFVDRAQLLKGVGGIFGTYKQPSNFICLFYKLLELEPSNNVIDYFLNTRVWQMKHLRLLAALYIRFAYPSNDVYLKLEPLLTHYEKVAILTDDGYVPSHFDEIIDQFLKQKLWCGIQLPPLPPRYGIPPRFSQLNDLREQLRIRIFNEMGMDPEGNLYEVVQEKKKLRLKGKKLVLRSKHPKKDQPEIPEQTNSDDDIESENLIRAQLGLPLLRT